MLSVTKSGPEGLAKQPLRWVAQVRQTENPKWGAVIMRQKTFTVGAITTVAATAVLLWSTASFAAPPTLGPDCGTGASIVGSDSAGKVELGTDASNRSTCTLTFALPKLNAPACMTVNETNGGGYSTPVGTITTTTTVVIGGALPWVAGDVISYICVSY